MNTLLNNHIFFFKVFIFLFLLLFGSIIFTEMLQLEWIHLNISFLQFHLDCLIEYDLLIFLIQLFRRIMFEFYFFPYFIILCHFVLLKYQLWILYFPYFIITIVFFLLTPYFTIILQLIIVFTNCLYKVIMNPV